MAVKYLSIALLISLQVAIAFCRSTEKPIDDVGGTMANDYYTHDPIFEDYIRYSRKVDTALIVGITVGVFGVIFSIIGIIILLCRKNVPRRGYIVNSDADGQAVPVQQPGTVSYVASGDTVSMQNYPPHYMQTQQQNIYPAVPPAQ